MLAMRHTDEAPGGPRWTYRQRDESGCRGAGVVDRDGAGRDERGPDDGEPCDGSAAMSGAGAGDGRTVTEEVPWREQTGYARHAACLVAARLGDRGALHALVVDLNPLVWHVARGQVLDNTVAEDVVQTVWLTLMRKLDKVSEPKALAQWLITTTRREATRHRTAGGGRIEPLTEDTEERLVSEDGLPEDEALRSDRNRLLWRAFRRLPPRCQELLRLTVISGRAEYDYVASELGMPRGSIGPTRGRCIATLRGYLTNEGGTS
jgi:RNA polymerase sigma factor (sigma-70 family)